MDEKVNLLPNKDHISDLSESLIAKHEKFTEKASNISTNAQVVLDDVNRAIEKSNQIKSSIEGIFYFLFLGLLENDFLFLLKSIQLKT